MNCARSPTTFDDGVTCVKQHMYTLKHLTLLFNLSAYNPKSAKTSDHLHVDCYINSIIQGILDVRDSCI